MLTRHLPTCIALLLAAACSKGETPSEDSTIVTDSIAAQVMEAYPDDVIEAIQKRDSALLISPAFADAATEKRVDAVVRLATLWRPGDTIRVAFRGGSAVLRDSVAAVANRWAESANLTFDFFANPGARTYREWSPSDSRYAAHIRVAFDGGDYWSMVGRESVDPTLRAPGTTSLNLGGFVTRMPADWSATVLHEFGHAIGLEHEHKHPQSTCEADFRFEDDPGYVRTIRHGQFAPDPSGKRPGIYTVLGGPPNNWRKEKVDFNLRSFAFSDVDVLAFDSLSIMKYHFPEWMYRNGRGSQCFSATEATVLSPGDQAAASHYYPQQLVAGADNRLQVARDSLAVIPLDAATRAKLTTALRQIITRQASAAAAVIR